MELLINRLANQLLMPFCRECGKEINNEWATCPFCSVSLQIDTLHPAAAHEYEKAPAKSSDLISLANTLPPAAAHDYEKVPAKSSDLISLANTLPTHQSTNTQLSTFHPPNIIQKPIQSEQTGFTNPFHSHGNENNVTTNSRQKLAKQYTAADGLGLMALVCFYLMYYGWIFGRDSFLFVQNLGFWGWIIFFALFKLIEPSDEYVIVKSPIDGKDMYECSECGWEPNLEQGWLDWFFGHNNNPKKLISKHWEDVRGHKELSESEWVYENAKDKFKSTALGILLVTIPCCFGIFMTMNQDVDMSLSLGVAFFIAFCSLYLFKDLLIHGAGFLGAKWRR